MWSHKLWPIVNNRYSSKKFFGRNESSSQVYLSLAVGQEVAKKSQSYHYLLGAIMIASVLT